jgi:hypothetical protein
MIRIRFEPEKQRCEFESGEVKISLFPCDRTDISVAWKRLGVTIPADAWKTIEIDGKPCNVIDRSKMTADEAHKLEQDEDFLIASKLDTIEGVDFDGFALANLSEQDRTDLVTILRRSIPAFHTWCAHYVRGGEKKSGRMATN